MRFQNLSFLTGTTLSMLLAVVAVQPARAQSDNVDRGTYTNQSPDSMNSSQYNNMRGIVQSVYGNVVRIRLANGQTKDIQLLRSEMQRLNLRPGMEVVATVYPGGLGSIALVDNTVINNYSRDNSGINAASQPNTDNFIGTNPQPGQSLRGTITSMAGDSVTMTLADGSTRTIAIPRLVQENLNLQPGTSITARRLSNGNVAIAIGNDIEGSSSAANTYSTDMSSSSRTSNSTDNIRLGSNPYGNVVAQQVVTGTITAINGDSISISGADNTTQTVNINPALLDRLNLRVGSPVSIMTMSDGSVRVARGVNSDASPIGENPTTLDSSNMISTPQQRRIEQYPLSRNAQSDYNLRNTTMQQTQNSTNTTSDNQNNNSTNDNSNTQNNSGVRALW